MYTTSIIQLLQGGKVVINQIYLSDLLDSFYGCDMIKVVENDYQL